MTSPADPRSDTVLLANLAQIATQDASELLRAEFALAKEELVQDLRRAGKAAVGLIAGVLLLEVAFGLLALAVLLAFGPSSGLAFVLSAVYATAAIGAGFYVAHARPAPLAVAKRQVARDVQEIAEALK
ncbi:MAG TPA: phage holin family protein [Polyangiaceae bacterium]|jgi:uncharacterized membrane protein YqjE